MRPFLGLILALASVLDLSCRGQAQERPRPPVLSVKSARRTTEFDRDQLLSHPSARSLVLQDAPAYPGRPLPIRAVPLRDLIPSREVDAGDVLQFECLDGFIASIPAEIALADRSDAARALLAVEDPSRPWPPLKDHPAQTAGPYYLVWERASLGGILREQWPFQVRSITVTPPPEKEFPALAPSTSRSAAAPEWEGFRVFIRDCSPCHRLNGMGRGSLGPDLNVPMNPTEYFRDGILEKYIRDPGSVRRWDHQRMPSFPESALPESDLRHLCAYLKQMADRKLAAPGP